MKMGVQNRRGHGRRGAALMVATPALNGAGRWSGGKRGEEERVGALWHQRRHVADEADEEEQGGPRPGGR